MSTGVESKGWWHTLPGVFTAVAGLITAVTGLLVALHQMGVLEDGGAPDPSAAEEVAESAEREGTGSSPSAEAAPFEPVRAGGPVPTSPGAVVTAFYDALWAGDGAALRATLAPNHEIDIAALRAARSQAGALNQISDELNDLFGLPDETLDEAQPGAAFPTYEVEGVRQSGRRAQVLVAPAEGAAGARHAFDLIRVEGAWKIVRQGAPR